ncbi:hypothetical protein OG589_34175 [Sphaerisporangium sp. NBC_01403]|uniref:hypothetical protein n=1 Tax=Sphaerisporangium sp. NBC_01403 TaxID=2903599 RepID=UPI00324A8137
MNTDIDRLVASIAPDPGPGMTPGARELLQEITKASAIEHAPTQEALHVRRRAWDRVFSSRSRTPTKPVRRWRLLAPLAVVTVLLSWVLPEGLGLGPLPASAALDIKREGVYYVVTVKDLFAAPQRYQTELEGRGLKIAINVVPVGPSLEGHILIGSNDIKPLEQTGPCHRWYGCDIGMKVPVGYKGKADIWLGRRAIRGEKYQLMTPIFAPGEPLHCVGFINERVLDVRRMLDERGVNEIRVTAYEKPSPIPDWWYVLDGVSTRAGGALLLVGPAPRPVPPDLSQTCPGHAPTR